MKKYLLAAASIFLVTSLSVFAAGGGGGGGGVSTPTPTPDPVPTIVTTPEPASCAQGPWACAEWNSCQMNGHQTRTCALNLDCKAAATTPKPAEDQVCSGLKCGQLSTLKERVQCRLELKPAELKTEFDILYFPEYCKVEETEEEQKECIALYKAFKPCWDMPMGAKRLKCGMKVSGIKKTPESDRIKCNKQKGDAKKSCQEEVKESTEHYILFQMYEYSMRAENMLKKQQAVISEVTDFDVFVEETKQKVEKTNSTTTWKKLLKEVKNKFAILMSE